MSSKSYLGSYALWEKQEIARINAFSNREVLKELRSIMEGLNYSWVKISQGLRFLYEAGKLQLEHFEPGNILYEWNVLCDEKLSWDKRGCPSFHNSKFNRSSLFKLKIIPTQAGLGGEGRSYAIRNMDDASTKVLTVGEFCASDGHRNGNGRFGFFYHEGPEYGLEYIHDRVEG